MRLCVSIVCLILFLCTGCSNQDYWGQFNSDNSLSASGRCAVVDDKQNQADELEPSWAVPRQNNGELFTGLNLDGIGIDDDSVYISRYTWDTFGQDCNWCVSDSTIIVLRAHLGTGETVSSVLPVDGEYTLQFAPLFSTQKDAILLEIKAPLNQVGYSYVYAFDVLPMSDKLQSPAKLELRLDAENTLLKSGKHLSKYIVTDGTSIVDVAGQELKGIKIYTTGPNAEWRELSETIYWTGDGWELAS